MLDLHIFEWIFAFYTEINIVNNSYKLTPNACKCFILQQISYYEMTPKYDIVIFATEVTPIVDIKKYYGGTQRELDQVIVDLDSFDYEGKQLFIWSTRCSILFYLHLHRLPHNDALSVSLH